MNHITTKFERLANTYGLQDGDDLKDLVEAFYDAGISAALQQSNCKEAVLTHGYKHEPKFLREQPVELTQAQVQFLSSVLNKILNEFETSKQIMKRHINVLWNESNPEDPDTTGAYHQMNLWKNLLREVKQTYNKMAATQRVLKKLQKTI